MSVCLNHTDRPAANRCSSCLKPICNECVVPAENAIYCSNDCRDKAAAHAARVSNLGPAPRSNPLAGVASLLGVLIVVAVAGWLAWPHLPHALKASILHAIGHH